nr:hypothetical protein [Tanacetum cinerariifolium]
VEATDDSPAVPEHTTVEIPMNMSLENKARFLAEKEAIHLILTGIEDDIYSTIDALHAVKTTDDSPAVPEHTTVETPTNMCPENKAYFLAEKEAIHLILTGIGDDIYSTVDACQIAQEMWEATERENVGSKVVHQSGIQCFNCKEYGHFAKECRKPKRVKDSAYHKEKIKPKRVKDSAYYNEKMLLYKQAEQGVPLQAEQYDWLADMDEEVDEQELEAHYSYMAKIQE